MTPLPIQENPRVSVVLPIYNAAAHLTGTLQTVLAQSLQEWELIAVDDGSTDCSADIVNEWARRDSRVQLLCQANAGVSIARNRAVAESRAPLIAFLDADDLWHPDKLLTHVDRHRSAPLLGVSYARVGFLNAAGRPTGRVASQPKVPLQPADLLCENATTTTSNWVVRREIFQMLGGFAEEMRYSEDLEWLLRVACDGRWRIELIEQVLTYYRTSESGLSSNLQCMEQGWLHLIRAARCYAPCLVEKEFAAAQAVHLRYLAHRSLRLHSDPAEGLDFLLRAMRSSPRRLLQQPSRTLITAIALLYRLLLHRVRALLPLKSPHDLLPILPAPAVSSTVTSLDSVPLVSVVIPLYNSAATVRESLDSVLRQTYLNLEIIVVDDGSTDQGLALVQQVQDSRLRVIRQSNRGLAGARNTGIRLARGSILAFLDSDDLWTPEKIDRHVTHLCGQPEVGISYSCSAFIDESSRLLGLYQIPALQNITPELILCRNPISNGSCLVLRREVLDDIRFEANLYGTSESYWFDETFRQSEDIECWIRIALQTRWQIEGIGEVLTFYRLSRRGLSANLDQQFASWQRVLDKTATYAPELIKRHGQRALGYQLRYLARRAIRERDFRISMKLSQRAISAYPGLLLEEPLRTAMTLSASYISLLVPGSVFRALEQLMIQITGARQRRRISSLSLLHGGCIANRWYGE